MICGSGASGIELASYLLLPSKRKTVRTDFNLSRGFNLILLVQGLLLRASSPTTTHGHAE
jgi:hypothetical protein